MGISKKGNRPRMAFAAPSVLAWESAVFNSPILDRNSLCPLPHDLAGSDRLPKKRVNSSPISAGYTGTTSCLRVSLMSPPLVAWERTGGGRRAHENRPEGTFWYHGIQETAVEKWRSVCATSSAR